MGRNAFTGKPSNADLYLELGSTVTGVATVQVKDIFGNNKEGEFLIDFQHGVLDTATGDINISTALATNAFTRDTSTTSYVMEQVTKRSGVLQTAKDGSGAVTGKAAQYLIVHGVNGEKNHILFSS